MATGAWLNSRVLELPRKLAGAARLLLRDPETLGRNLLQFTDPGRFETRLIDVMHARPMHVRFDADVAGVPRLNVLDAAWSPLGMTGGPNTVINLAIRILRQGIKVRLVSTVGMGRLDPVWLRNHVTALAGAEAAECLESECAADAEAPLVVGAADMFLATHWTTAQQVRDVLPHMPIRQFFYMLQEFEPAFYPWSSNYCRAIETYGMDFWPIINQSLLAEFLFSQPFGRLQDAATRARAVVFEPAVDATLFHPPPLGTRRPRRLLFYARPNNTRNMFGLGLMALREIAQSPAFEGWEFIAVGGRGSVPEMALGGGHRLQVGPWVDYAGYANLLRDADLLLCPMLSPHTSYPVLEMAACGGIAITNEFSVKTRARLGAMSRNIHAVEPTLEGFVGGLTAAARIVNSGMPRIAALDAHRDWGAALDPAARRIGKIIRTLHAAAQGLGWSAPIEGARVAAGD